MHFIRKPYRSLEMLFDLLHKAASLRYAKRKLLSDTALSAKEKALLEKISLRVHSRDAMYSPAASEHYLSVGLSAIRCIEDALKNANADGIRSILDFPCGHGRVLRFLKARFPDAEFIASEIDTGALDFCRRVFGVKPVISHADVSKVSLPDKVDLIWCGSLITHLKENVTTDLLTFMHKHLSPGGVCVFTTHGRRTVEWIQNKTTTYGLPERVQQELLSQFHETGYAYTDYENQNGYGISIASHEHMLALARSVGRWKETSFLEHGWDDHQDVYGFTSPR